MSRVFTHYVRMYVCHSMLFLGEIAGLPAGRQRQGGQGGGGQCRAAEAGEGGGVRLHGGVEYVSG